MRRLGPIWEVRFEGRTASIVGSKGMLDIARLLERPGREIHVLDLMGSLVPASSSEGVVDRTAAGAYRRRLQELSEERLDAESAGDVHRLEGIDSELEALSAELQTATGVGGRDRTFANHPTERARKAVSARIRDAIRRVEHASPALAAHLDSHVVTGIRCRYEGDERWDIEY